MPGIMDREHYALSVHQVSILPQVNAPNVDNQKPSDLAPLQVELSVLLANHVIGML